PDAINRAQYLTPRLNREEIELVITGPARVFAGNVESTLVAELINSVGSDPDQLPVLQHALARMWEFAAKRNGCSPLVSCSEFKDTGGIRTALCDHADEILHSLGEELEPLAEILFRALTDQREGEGGGQAVRRPQSLAQVAEWSGRQWNEFLPIVRAFTHPDV